LLLLLLLLVRVMIMCEWYFNPPDGFAAAAVAGLWFNWLLICVCGTGSKQYILQGCAMYAVLCCCCCRRLPSSTTFHAINNHRCLLLALTGTRTVVLAIHCRCHIITITTTTSIVPTTPCPPAQLRLSPSSAAADYSTPLACDVM
jgi:hypothetical protein